MVSGGSPLVNLSVSSFNSWRSSLKKHSHKTPSKKVTLAIWYAVEMVYPKCPALETGRCTCKLNLTTPESILQNFEKKLC